MPQIATFPKDAELTNNFGQAFKDVKVNDAGFYTGKQWTGAVWVDFTMAPEQFAALGVYEIQTQPAPEASQPKVLETNDPDQVHVKQPRYQGGDGTDWIDDCARDFTSEEFMGAMKFTIGKYLKRLGKKDDPKKELLKMEDYCRRTREYLEERGW